MSVPRITLWTKPFQMAFRLSVRPFKDTHLDKQAANIQASKYRYITITPGALYILSSIAGRRMTEPARWILFDSLRDILHGKLRTQYPEKQDLLASTFGELLGVILLTQHLGGDIEIVRLLESNYGKMPDFILIQTTATAQTAHILECKGRVEDVRNINNRTTEYDLCHEIRGFRDDAIEQIETMDFSQIKTGARTIIQQSKLSFGISQLVATENVLISSVPDARIIHQCRSSVKFASRKECSPRVTCKMCITSKQDSSQANIISVLHQKKLATRSKTGQGLLSFIARYHSVQRAAWSGNDTFFETSLNNFINRLPQEDLPNILPSAIFMTVTLMEAAISEGLTLAHIESQVLSEIAPEPLQRILEQVNDLYHDDTNQRQTLQTEMPNPTATMAFSDIISPTNLPLMEGNSMRQEKREQDRSLETQNEENLQWYTTNQSIRRISNFIRDEYTTTKLLIGTTVRDDYIYGSVQYEDRFITIIRLTSAKMDYAALKYYVEGLITQLRSPNARSITWRYEYFQENDREKFFVGESWDEFPYPNPVNDAFPGITAWIARDGRAEIIVRRREVLPQ